MVNDNDLPCSCNCFGTFNVIEVVYVGNHQKRIGVHHIQAFSGINKNALVLLKFGKLFKTGCKILIAQIGNNVHVCAAIHGKTRQTDSGAEGIEVAESVSHDQNVIRTYHIGDQLIGNHTGADIGTLEARFGLTAVKSNAFIRFIRRLVSSAQKCHIESELRRMIALRK